MDASHAWGTDMENNNDQIALGKAVETVADTLLKSLGSDFRWELAFPDLTEDMVARLQAYGNQESFPAGAVLYTHGDRKIDDVAAHDEIAETLEHGSVLVGCLNRRAPAGI